MQNKKYRMLTPKDWRSFTDTSLYSAPETRSTTFDLSEHFRQSDVSIGSHFLQDAFLMHYRPWTDLVFNPASENSWKSILEKEYMTQSYQELNEKISKSPALAMMATTNFLDSIIKVAKKSNSAIATQQTQSQPQQQPQGNQPQGGNQPGNQPFNFNSFMNTLNAMQGSGNPQNSTIYQTTMSLMESAINSATEDSLELSSMVDAFSHSGIPMRKLTDPDEMREILSNRFIISLAKVMKKLNTDDTGKNAVKPSVRRGRPIGVKSLSSFSELPDVLPQELLLDNDFLAYKIVSRTVHVRQRYSSMNKYLVYLDKSGSMGGSVKFGTEYVPKIAVASASIMGLAKSVKTLGGSVTLKLFDTEVQEAITDMWDLLKTLSKISADGGTQITGVLQDIAVHGNDYKSVIVSDGIDSIKEDAAKAVSRMDVTSVLIQTGNNILEKYTKAVKVNSFGTNNILMEV